MKTENLTVTKTRAPRKESGKPRAPQTVYVVRGKDGKLHYVGKDESAAKAASAQHCHGIKPEEYGSRASLAELAPTVILEKWLASKNLASLYTSLGGKFGARSQNEDAQKSIATILARAFANCSIPLPNEFADGEWKIVSTGGTSKGPSDDEKARIAALQKQYSAAAQG